MSDYRISYHRNTNVYPYPLVMVNEDNTRVYESTIETCRSIIIRVDMRYHITA